jgi:hypothetical protein
VWWNASYVPKQGIEYRDIHIVIVPRITSMSRNNEVLLIFRKSRKIKPVDFYDIRKCWRRDVMT